MFTGIIQAKGRIDRLEPNAFGMRLLVDPAGWSYQPSPGDSIAVNGVCLTYAPQSARPGHFAFDVIKETLAQTNLGSLQTGDLVNLESCLTPTTPMGGHFVQGHIDGMGRVAAVYDGSDEWRTTIEVSPALMPYIVPKGSITIDGISLTIASVEMSKHQFTVALIPTTLELTCLGDRAVGDTVNLETDIIARTVVHWLSHFAGSDTPASTLTLEKLRDAGFTG